MVRGKGRRGEKLIAGGEKDPVSSKIGKKNPYKLTKKPLMRSLKILLVPGRGGKRRKTFDLPRGGKKGKGYSLSDARPASPVRKKMGQREGKERYLLPIISSRTATSKKRKESPSLPP